MQTIRDPWPATLTPHERFRRQMHHQAVDRTFHMEFGYGEENFDRWAILRDNGIRNNGEANRFFGFDPIADAGPPWMQRGLRLELHGDYASDVYRLTKKWLCGAGMLTNLRED